LDDFYKAFGTARIVSLLAIKSGFQTPCHSVPVSSTGWHYLTRNLSSGFPPSREWQMKLRERQEK